MRAWRFQNIAANQARKYQIYLFINISSLYKNITLNVQVLVNDHIALNVQVLVERQVTRHF